MAYPEEREARAEWWKRKLDHAETVMAPYINLGKRMQTLYENGAITVRESYLDSLHGNVDPTARAKPSLGYGYIEQATANSNARDPVFRVEPMNKMAVDGAPSVGKVLNHYWKVTGQRHQDMRVMRDAYCLYGVKKEGWTASLAEERGQASQSDLTDLIVDDPTEENLWLSAGEPTKVLEHQDHAEHRAKHKELLENPDDLSEEAIEVIREHDKEHRLFQEEGAPDNHVDIQREAPYGVRWPFEDFRMDPYSTDGLRDARWIAFKVTKPIDEVKNNRRFYTEARAQLEPTGRAEHAPEPMFGEDDFGMVTYWEIWARNFAISSRRRMNLLTVVAEQAGSRWSLLRHEAWPYKRLENYPAKLLTFNQGIKKTWFSKPFLIMAGIDNVQGLMDEVLDAILSTTRKQKNIVLYDSEIVGEEEATAAVRGAGDQLIGIPGLASAGANAVVPLNLLEIRNDGMQLVDTLLSMFDRAAGPLQPGGASNDSDTATEEAINERKITAREGLRDDLFEEYQMEVAQDFWALHTQYQPDTEFLIDEKAREYSTITGDVVKGQYRFEIDVSSRATAQALERRQWGELLQQSMQLVEVSSVMGLPPPNLPKIFEQYLARGWDIKNPEDLWPAIGMEELDEMLQNPAMAAQVIQARQRLGGSPEVAQNAPGAGRSTNEIALTAAAAR